ncbi:MAG: hypothetical protein FJ264_03310 [Planctomycetes bacterium]|nr:hypothetical protein [Planctomycetota bacterium]
MRKITLSDVNRWKKNSFELALRLGYKQKILSSVLHTARYSVLPGYPPEGNWYGWCKYHPSHPEIAVYEYNLSTHFSESNVIKSALLKKGMPSAQADEIINKLRPVSPEDFFEVFNQSGMDHEAIGHLYHRMDGQDCSEKAAVRVQIQLAHERRYLAWELIREVMPAVLGYQFNIAEFNKTQ